MAHSMTTLTEPYSALALRPGQALFRGHRHKKGPHAFGIAAPKLAVLDPVPVTAPKLYDPRIAYLTTVVSAWAYSDGETMANQLSYYGLPDCTVRQFVVVNRAMLIVACAYFVRSRCGRIGVLVFRGTVPDDFINWLTDANTSLQRFHFGHVHAGFFRNVEPLWKDIAEAVDEALETAGEGDDGQPGGTLQNLYVTGHSLGAAMAVIAAARIFVDDYASWQPVVRGVYTYGQPMVGDADFCEHYERRLELYRHVYRRDVVPHLPPLEVGRFAHFGREFLATEPSRGWQNQDPPRVKQCALAGASAAIAVADFFARRLIPLQLPLPYSLEDHGPQGYIDTSRLSLG
jgi:hypothetical protein